VISCQGSGLDNVFRLLKEPFSGKSEHLDRLINEVDLIELTVSYLRGPTSPGGLPDTLCFDV
jgi:hypothetical protein